MLPKFCLISETGGRQQRKYFHATILVSISELVSRAVTKGKTSKTALLPGFRGIECGGAAALAEAVTALISMVLNSACA